MNPTHINTIREFNRLYTKIIGLLDKYILDSQFTLPEVRVLYELYNNGNMTASDIVSYLQIDKGYLSRILKQFEKKKLILKVRSKEDKRSTYITLSKIGKSEFEKLNQASNDQIVDILCQLSDEDCRQLTETMSSIKLILEKIRK